MARTDNQDKSEIIREFETMKSLELSARDLYTQIAAAQDAGPQKIKTAFTSLAADEQRHADLVQEIINIVTNAL
jgi:rubrerythrin